MSSTNIYFFTIDSDAAHTLCSEMLAHYGLTWEHQSSAARISGERLDEFVQWVQGFFGSSVAVGDSLESIAFSRLKTLKLKLATAESCTGGLLAYYFTSLSGISEVFLGGVISYANTIKEQLLDVRTTTLEDFGAVSEQVVAQMLSGALKHFGADVAIASSGVAGPNGGSALKPVGTVFLGVQVAGKAPCIEHHFFEPHTSSHASIHAAKGVLSPRQSIQDQACTKAIEILLKNI